MVSNFDNVSGPTMRPASLAHIVLKTTDKDGLVAWYTKFLGSSVRHQNEIIAFLSYDEEHHRLAIAQLPGLTAKDKKSVGMDHFAFTYSSLQDLLLVYRQRKAKGILPVWCVNHGVTMSLYYQDPDGNKIETQADILEDPEAANAYMMSPEFVENPIGVDFDPEDLIKRLENGEAAESLMKRANIGPRQTIPVF